MKTALIFLHGDLTDMSLVKKYAQAADMVIAADGGAEHAQKMGITPHLLIGDLDSIPPDLKTRYKAQNVPMKVYPREKDYTDAELAIQYAQEQKATHIAVAGFLGSRLDHMLGILLHLSRLRSNITILEGRQKLFFIKKQAEITGKKNDELSLIPLESDCVGISTEGLYYPLRDETLTHGSTRGISNVFLDEHVVVKVKKGTLLAIFTDK